MRKYVNRQSGIDPNTIARRHNEKLRQMSPSVKAWPLPWNPRGAQAAIAGAEATRKVDGGAPWWRRNALANWAGWR